MGRRALSSTLSHDAVSHTAFMKRSNNARSMCIMSVSWGDVEKWLVELGGNPHTAWRTLSHVKTGTSPSPNWRGNCGAQH